MKNEDYSNLFASFADAVYAFVNDCLILGDFDIVDRFLIKALESIQDNFNIDVAITFLTITLAAKSKLKNREAFFKFVEKTLDPKQDSRLLHGLQ